MLFALDGKARNLLAFNCQYALFIGFYQLLAAVTINCGIFGFRQFASLTNWLIRCQAILKNTWHMPFGSTEGLKNISPSIQLPAIQWPPTTKTSQKWRPCVSYNDDTWAQRLLAISKIIICESFSDIFITERIVMIQLEAKCCSHLHDGDVTN